MGHFDVYGVPLARLRVRKTRTESFLINTGENNVAHSVFL